jgi:hypothetical protein
MTDDHIFPAWITHAVNKNSYQIDPKSREFFEKLIELIPHFDKAFLSIPATSEVGVLKSYDPKEVQKQIGLESPNEFILLNILELFYFQAIYQLRELALSLIGSLADGRLYVAALTNRAMLEVVCINYYTLRRAEKQFNQCMELLKNTAKTKSQTVRSRLLNSYYQGTYEIFSKIFDANSASSINWAVYLENRFNVKIKNANDAKKIHVGTAIPDIEKQSGLPINNSYTVLSEFVHPNAGSKMLIVKTKQTGYPLMDVLTIGENKENVEAALFFVDHLAESIYYAWTLSLTFLQRGQKLIEAFDQLVPKEFSRNIH